MDLERLGEELPEPGADLTPSLVGVGGHSSPPNLLVPFRPAPFRGELPSESVPLVLAVRWNPNPSFGMRVTGFSIDLHMYRTERHITVASYKMQFHSRYRATSQLREALQRH